MTSPPGVRVLRGAPTPEEEQAVREAILRLWREGMAAVARARAPIPWILAARAQGTDPAMLARGGQAWRLSGRSSDDATARRRRER